MASNGDGNFGAFVVRAGKSLFLHLLVLAILLGVGAWSATGYEAASEQLKAQFQSAPDPVVAVVSVLDQLRLRLWLWSATAVGIAWLASCIFIGLAQGDEPRRDAESRARTGLWFMLLVVVIFAAALSWWLQASLADVGVLLTSFGYGLTIFACFLLTILGFWAATGMFVKSTMRLSVPLSGLLPRVGN